MRRTGGTAASLLALEDYERLPDDGARLELSEGRLVREPQPGAEHGAVVVNLLRALDRFVHERGLGRVVVESGFMLSERPPTVRRPDAAFVSANRWPGRSLPDGFWPFAPDLAAEVVSPSNTAAELNAKILEYLTAGTLVVWIVHPGTRTVEVWRPGPDVRLLREKDVLEGMDALPGFRLPIGELFEY